MADQGGGAHVPHQGYSERLADQGHSHGQGQAHGPGQAHGQAGHQQHQQADKGIVVYVKASPQGLSLIHISEPTRLD
eukprot:7851125-Prorocentrum_lima.AAC.1